MAVAQAALALRGEKILWLLSPAESAELSASAFLPARLASRLKKFAKAEEGGWLLSGERLSRLDDNLMLDSKPVNGIVLTEAEKAALPGDVPGEFVHCD